MFPVEFRAYVVGWVSTIGCVCLSLQRVIITEQKFRSGEWTYLCAGALFRNGVGCWALPLYNKGRCTLLWASWILPRKPSRQSRHLNAFQTPTNLRTARDRRRNIVVCAVYICKVHVRLSTFDFSIIEVLSKSGCRWGRSKGLKFATGCLRFFVHT